MQIYLEFIYTFAIARGQYTFIWFLIYKENVYLICLNSCLVLFHFGKNPLKKLYQFSTVDVT